MYKKYQNFFLKNKISGFPEIRNTPLIRDSYSTFNILVKNREILIKILKKNNISYKIYYPKPLYNQYNLKKKIKFKNFKNIKDALNDAFFIVRKKKFINYTILFSPCAASFDSFKNFEERGYYFNNLVRKYLNGKKKFNT